MATGLFTGIGAFTLGLGHVGVNDITGGSTKNARARLIEASIISEAWNTAQVAIFKWAKTNWRATDKTAEFSPSFSSDKREAEEGIACIDVDYNYMISSWL